MCTLGRYYVHWHVRHLEFEPSGSVVAPNLMYFKWHQKNRFLTKWSKFVSTFDEKKRSACFVAYARIERRTHAWSIDACLVSCFGGRQQCRQFVLYLRTSKVHKISVFKEHTLICPFWKSQIWNPPFPRNSSSKNSPMPPEFQFKDPPLPPPMPSEFRKAVRRWVRIFSGIAQFKVTVMQNTVAANNRVTSQWV